MWEGGDFNTGANLANGCNAGNPGQTGYDNWCCNPDGSSGYSGRLSWDPLTVLIAVRGPDAAHMGSATDVTIAVSESGGESQSDGGDGSMKRVGYTSGGGAQTAIASDVGTMLCVAPSAADDDAAPVPAAVTSSDSGKCLHVVGGSGTSVPDYTNVNISTCSGGDEQAWERVGTTIRHVASGKCLDADSSNGDRVQVYSYTGASNQNWAVTAAGAVVNGKNSKCLDVYGFGTADGTDVWTYTCSGTSNQKWAGL